MIKIKKMALLCLVLSLGTVQISHTSDKWFSFNKQDKMDENERLSQAIQNHNFTAIEKLVENQPQGIARDDFVNFQSEEGYGDGPLHQAIQAGCGMRIIQFLIDNGAEVDMMNDAGQTPLSIAAQMLRLDVVTEFLEHNVEIDRIDSYGSTPLFLALNRKCFANDPELSYNQLEIVKLLVGRGANIHYKIDSPRSRSPLTLAQHGARYGRYEQYGRHGRADEAVDASGRHPDVRHVVDHDAGHDVAERGADDSHFRPGQSQSA